MIFLTFLIQSNHNHSQRGRGDHKRASEEPGTILIATEEPFGGGEGDESASTDHNGMPTSRDYDKSVSVDVQGVVRKISTLPPMTAVLFATTKSSYNSTPDPTAQTSAASVTYCPSIEPQNHDYAIPAIVVVENKPLGSSSTNETVQNQPQPGNAY